MWPFIISTKFFYRKFSKCGKMWRAIQIANGNGGCGIVKKCPLKLLPFLSGIIAVFNRIADFSRTQKDELICIFTGPMRALIRRVIWQRSPLYVCWFITALSSAVPSVCLFQSIPKFRENFKSSSLSLRIANVFKCSVHSFAYILRYNDIRWWYLHMGFVEFVTWWQPAAT